jgi:predicted nucleic-acid-binding protein
MIGLDTNILVRLVMQDDPKQTKQVIDFLSKAQDAKVPLFINNVVLCELVWVLLRGYKKSKVDIVLFLMELLYTKNVCFSNKEILRHAIELYKKGKGDFADYLTAAYNNDKKCSHTYSFDEMLIQEKIFHTLDSFS